MMKILFVLVLSACASEGPNPTPGTPDAGQLSGPCGPRPLAPGYTATFPGNGTATLAETEYRALHQWREDMDVWAACADGMLR